MNCFKNLSSTLVSTQIFGHLIFWLHFHVGFPLGEDHKIPYLKLSKPFDNPIQDLNIFLRVPFCQVYGLVSAFGNILKISCLIGTQMSFVWQIYDTNGDSQR